MKKYFFLLSAVLLLLAPCALQAQGGAGQQLCGATTLPYGSVVNIPASRQNCFQITLTGNVTSSWLDFPYTGEWIYLTIRQDSVGGRTFTPPYNVLNWQPIDTRPYSDTPGATAGVTTEEGYFDGQYWQIVGGYSSSSAGCSNGATKTQYVDSGQGSDSNSGLNWCSAKLTEAAAITALGSGGGWVYVAPNYTGAFPGSVPANVHILQANQFDAVSPSVQRFSFPDWTTDTQDVLPQFSTTSGSLSDFQTTWNTYSPFGASYLRSGLNSEISVPSSSTAASSEDAAITGLAHISGANSQGTGVEGICVSEFNPTDCTGVVGLAAASTAANSSSSLEGGWFQVATASQPSGINGAVITTVGGHAPTSSTNPASGSGNAAIDVRGASPGNLSSGNVWPNGLWIDKFSVTLPVFLGAGAYYNGSIWTHLTDCGNNGIELGWTYAAATDETDQIRVQGNCAGTYPYGGDLQIINSRTSSTVTLQTQAGGTVSVDSLKAVTFSATPTFDRSLGKVQTITLSANVTSSTLANCSAGQTVIFDIIENGTGGFTFVPPANLHGFTSITTTAGYHNRQMFYCDGSNSNSGGWSVPGSGT